MEYFKSILSTLLLITCSVCSTAQDYYFTQYDRAPILLSPALTGQFDGDYRVMSNYRSALNFLGPDRYQSFILAGDTQFKVGEDIIGLGLSGYRDVAGELSFSSTQINLSAAYHKTLGGGKHILSLGTAYGIGKRSVNLSDARWPSQHDGNGGFDDNTEVNLPTIFGTQALYSDMNLGAVWQSSFENNQNLRVGMTALHLNQPDISLFTGTARKLPIRYVLHADGEVGIGAEMAVLPSVLFHTQSDFWNAQTGVAFKKYNNDPSARLKTVQAGFQVRGGKNVQDEIGLSSLITKACLDFEKYSVGLSYDYGLLDTPTDLRFNAFEVSMGYVFGPSSEEVMGSRVYR